MNTHPAERETPAGEAMREAVARTIYDVGNKTIATALWKGWEPSPLVEDERTYRLHLAYADALLTGSGPIASELAHLTERAEKAETFALACELRIATTEAALTTQRADHAAEVARLTEALRFYADEDAWSGQPWRLQFESPGRDGHGSDTARDALAPKETTDA